MQGASFGVPAGMRTPFDHGVAVQPQNLMAGAGRPELWGSRSGLSAAARRAKEEAEVILPLEPNESSNPQWIGAFAFLGKARQEAVNVGSSESG